MQENMMSMMSDERFKNTPVSFMQRLLGDMCVMTGDQDILAMYEWLKCRKEVLRRHFPDQDIDSLTMHELFNKDYM